jgi:hypothetical protein
MKYFSPSFLFRVRLSRRAHSFIKRLLKPIVAYFSWRELRRRNAALSRGRERIYSEFGEFKAKEIFREFEKIVNE